MSIIDHYKKWKLKNPDTWIQVTSNQSCIETAISVAVFSKNGEGKINPHQRRLKTENLKKFNDNLLAKNKDVLKVKNFSELLKIIEDCKVKGIGDLACYDVANRIGCYFGKHPEFVYLHAGTKKGFEKLLKVKAKNKFLNKGDLPEPFRSSDLDCHAIEDILCIYKDKF